MIDREKVIEGLYCCSHTDRTYCIDCPYDNADSDCTALMSMDVLALLKKQEPVKPIWQERSQENVCARCGKFISTDRETDILFCKYCGQAVKWK